MQRYLTLTLTGKTRKIITRITSTTRREVAARIRLVPSGTVRCLVPGVRCGLLLLSFLFAGSCRDLLCERGLCVYVLLFIFRSINMMQPYVFARTSI